MSYYIYYRSFRWDPDDEPDHEDNTVHNYINEIFNAPPPSDQEEDLEPPVAPLQFSQAILQRFFANMYSSSIEEFLQQNVVVAPTEDELMRSTIVHMSEEDYSDACSICIDNIEKHQELRTIFHCMHTFHKECIDTWFKENVKCPMCRHDIRENIPE